MHFDLWARKFHNRPRTESGLGFWARLFYVNRQQVDAVTALMRRRTDWPDRDRKQP